ncbi:hypothetical protein F750_6008 [Streptomyces sp. PAMC 26508]|nr:hypothetical protein F750_6008 [Streptomyces sp. PAMC 26508]
MVMPDIVSRGGSGAMTDPLGGSAVPRPGGAGSAEENR